MTASQGLSEGYTWEALRTRPAARKQLQGFFSLSVQCPPLGPPRGLTVPWKPASCSSEVHGRPRTHTGSLSHPPPPPHQRATAAGRVPAPLGPLAAGLAQSEHVRAAGLTRPLGSREGCARPGCAHGTRCEPTEAQRLRAPGAGAHPSPASTAPPHPRRLFPASANSALGEDRAWMGVLEASEPRAGT